MYESRSVTEVARNFADYINRVFYRGERFVLVRGSKPVAEICPVPRGRHLGELPGLLASLPRLSEEEAKSLGADIAASRAALTNVEVRDPWES